MNKKRVAVPLVILGLFIGGYYGLTSYAGIESSLDGDVGGSGTIEAVEINIGSQVAAEVREVKVAEGQKIAKGDKLVILDDKLLKDQVKIAQAGVDAAGAAVDDADTSSERKIAKAQLAQAEATLSTAKIQQGYAAVTSPVDGVVLSLPFSEGEVASPGSTVAVIGKTKELDLTIYIDEKELGVVKIGQKAAVTVDAYPGEKFEGKVIEIASEAEFTPQNVQTKEQRSNLVFGVRFRIDNSKDKLKPGMPADVTLNM